MLWLLLGIGLLGLLLLSFRAIARADPRQLWQAGRALLIAAAVVLAVLLIATGRGGWLLAFAPLLLLLWRRHAGPRSWGGGRAGRTSQVSSRFLDMTLDHDTGEVDGRVREGLHAGARLADLPLDALLALRRTLAAADRQSLLLLEAFLDRRHADWRQREGAAEGGGPAEGGEAPGSNGGGGPGGGTAPVSPATMNREEALRVLGLNDGASEAEVQEAHRRLIRLVHPDHGGSPFLAAVVNRARDVLTGR